MSESFRLLVTGSRSWVDEQAIRGAVASVVMLRGPENMVVVHGACPAGADALADRIATGWGGGMRVERHPADWRRHGRRAGFVRNAEMVALGADLVLAFIDPCRVYGCPRAGRHGSHGAEHTVRLAEQAGIPVQRYERGIRRG